MDDCRRIYIKQIIIELAKKKQFLEKSENENKNESEVKQSGVYRSSSILSLCFVVSTDLFSNPFLEDLEGMEVLKNSRENKITF